LLRKNIYDCYKTRARSRIGVTQAPQSHDIGATGLARFKEYRSIATLRLQFRSHRRAFASNLEQVANLCALRSAQPPTLRGMGNE